MEYFMSGLLARANGKYVGDLVFPPTSDHVGDMLADEHIRGDNSSSSLKDIPSDASISFTENEVTETADISSEDMHYPSYVSLCGSSGYSSSPTYIRSDFYSLTPPTSPDLSKSSVSNNNTSARQLSFSIDSILGNDSSDIPEPNVGTDTHAQIFSSDPCCDETIEYQPKDSVSHTHDIQDQSATGNGSAPSTSIYWCHVCEDFCENQVNACYHQNIHLANTDNCRLRRLIFKQLGYVTAHEMTGYMNKLKCGLCEKITTYRFFKVHLSCHEGHVCEICDQEFPSSCRLRDHMTSHYGCKPYICKVCHEQFSASQDLNVHSRKHKSCIYRCNHCSQSFRTRHAQTVHVMSHAAGNSPFACLIPGCRKSFSQSVQLQLHFNAHMNKSSFQ